MKNPIKFLIVTFILSLFLFTQGFAADVANSTVTASETKVSVTFSGAVAYATADKEDNHTTQAMYGGWLDWENAVFTVYTTAVSGEDVNIFFQGGPSRDLTYQSTVYTQTVFDDVNVITSVTWYAYKDTINTAKHPREYFVDPNAYMPYKTIKFDGQTGNPALSVYTWTLYVPKKPGAPRTGAYGISDTT